VVIFLSPLDSIYLEPDIQLDKGSIGLACTFWTHTDSHCINKAFSLLLPRMISVHTEPHFRTPALLFNKCTTPAKRPFKSGAHGFAFPAPLDGARAKSLPRSPGVQQRS